MDADEVRAFREMLGLSQAAMARVFGVDRSTIRRWEEGETEAPLLLDLAAMTVVHLRGEMGGNRYPSVTDIYRVMQEYGVTQDIAIRAFGVEP